MEEPKICLGCFTEWEEGKKVCPHCRWNPEEKILDAIYWHIGDVLEQRYLIGNFFCTVRDMVVWRIYDNLLGIPCFVLINQGNSVDALASAALHLQAAAKATEVSVEVLAIKKLAKKNVLLFSMQDRYMEVETFERLLQADADEPESLIEKIEYASDDEKRKQLLPAGTSLGDRYRVIGCIGIGGFGITYLCEDILLHRNVALKEYFPAEWVERDGEYVAVKKSNMVEAYRFGIQSFLKEARITAKFIHTPHIVTIYDAIEANDTFYMVMKYIPGISIGREMRAREYKPYTPAEMADIILPVLEGLEQMHESRIVHSDISPGNIMRSEQGDIVLIDMGASKYALENQPILSAAFLKLDYAAPEQYRTGKEGIPKDEGSWTDIYAVGATMYYLLTGHKPTDVISRLSNRKTDLISPRKYKVRLSKQWMQLIHHAMELDRRERFYSVAELKEGICKLLK